MKSIIVICFVMFSVFTVDGQVTEHFSDETPGATFFSNSGVTYNLTGGKFDIEHGPIYGYTGIATDDDYVDNYGSFLSSAGVVGAITKTTNNFYVYDFWIFPGDGSGIKSNTGTIIIRGKLSGATQFTKTVESANINIISSTNNGYTKVDLTSFSTTEIDELEFELTGNLRYLAVDAFRHQSVAANATPTATAPSAPSVTEDDTNVALADDIQVADTDGDDQTVTFTITGGTLTIGTTGITFGGTGNGNASFTAAGTLAAINTALDAATFTPTPNLSGTNAGTIAFISNDGTDDSSPTSVSFDITAVNDDPSVSGLPTDITVSEDIASNVDLSAATLSDVDAGSNSIVLTIEASAGTLNAGSGGSVTIGGSGTATLSLTGSVANIDTYLNTSSNIKYTSASNVNGSDAATLTLTANDGGYTGSSGGTNVPLGTVNVDITAVNDKPTASSFTTSTIYENTTYAFVTANFGYSDDDGDPLDHVRITAVPANGSLWVDADGSGTINGAESALSNNGTVSKADLDAGKLKYLNTNGTSSIFTFDVSDGTDYSTSTYTATLTVTPEPTVTLSLDPSSSISENAGSTSVKATLSNTFNKTVSVNLLKSGTTSGTDYSLSSTSISITTGNITGTATITGVNDDLDEDNETVIIDISSVTNGTESGTQQVICTLTDDDNTPVVTASQSFSIAENIANSGAVGIVLATDGDAGTSFSSWTETGGTGASIFEINASSGAITVTDNSGIDYETTTSYTYTVTVSDGINTSASETIIINITDINDVDPVVTASQSFSIAENIANSGVVGTVLAADGDVTATIFSSWTETGGTGASIFEINASSGAITVTDNSGIDYETTTSYTYTVTVSDGTNTSASETITINITDVNDVAPIVTASQTFNIDEDASNTTSVGTVLATDGDATATVFSSWTITAGNTNGVFAINSSTGEITVNDANELDYESITSYSLSITVSDGVNTSAAETVTVNVNAINDNTPVVTASQSFSIAENIANSGAVGTVLATDGDAGTSFSSWTETGGTGASIFEINASSGAITVTDNSGIDYETTTSYTYTVTVSDGINTSASETIIINITDINDVDPVVTASQSFSIAENIANSGVVGTVLAADGDVTATIFSSWTETGGTGASIFEINASSGAITVTDNSGIDYETTTSYTYTVTVSDGTNTSASETITINITDVNDVAPIVTASQTFNIDEDASNTTSVGTVLATDGDATATVFSSWTITAGNTNGVFAINSSTGEITVNDANELDYESITSYSLSITVSDGVNTSVTETVTVDVNDINDEIPVFTSASTINIDENTTDVITLTATDGDVGTTFTFNKIGGADQALFTINSSTGALAFTSAPDYETPLDINADNDYIVQVSVSDGLNSSTQTITVSVDNVTGITITSNGGGATAGISIPENSTSIAAVTSVNEGVAVPSYSLVGGADQAKFNIHPTSGVLTLLSAPDYESAQDAGGNNSYEVIVRVTGDGGATDDQTITVTITDVNDITPVITATQSFSIAENTANSGAVGTVLATDGDAGTSFSAWTETGGTGASIFEINASSGAITVTDNSGIDYETTTSYTYTVTVSDGTNTSVSETITINITDVNDVTPVVTATQSFSIAENTANSGAVGTVLATDGDAGTSFSAWTETGGTGASIFEINASSGAITVTDNSGIDYETTTSYTYTVTVSDGINTSTAETITINITDVNDVTPVVTATQSFSIAENTADSGAVGTVLATDGDAGTSFSAWTETGGTGASIFEINASSGAITVTDNSGIDYETTTSYTYTVTVSDGINTSAAETITINITDVNDVAPIVTASQTFYIDEDASNTTSVGTVLATDSDATATTFSSWTITAGNTDGIFAVNSTTGEITVTDNTNLDYETTTSYSLTVTVSDGTHTSSEEIVIININDSNENAPTAIQLSNTTIAENSAIGTEVGILTASDADIDETFTFNLAENEYFELDGDRIVSKEIFNYEDYISYSLKVTVTDQGGLSYNDRFTINIENKNEAPRFISEPFVDAVLNESYVYMIEYQDVDAEGCVVTAFEKPSWLNLDDNGDGTATLYGLPTEAGTFNVILEAWDNEYLARQEFKIIVETVTGIEDVLTAPIVHIYPNPVVHELHIDLSDFRNDETTISLFSMTGSLIFKEEHKNIGGEVRIIKSVEQLRSGAYFLLIESEGYRKSYKIVKQ
ncbi:cadherin domain-containing protein [Labilibaculum sp.]|uniref:cadherin domain-containing protein n=1 Tax=Labilibaculum sp. TaxID=2060723 RepID=UPI002AA81191|nr:cadherin domain-containing protein [Labilibaculum sp.]